MAKRAQQGSGEERVTAKSRPMTNLTARMPSVVSSSASSNPGRTSYGHQDPERYVLDDSNGATCGNVKIRLFTKGLWSILVFSRVETMKIPAAVVDAARTKGIKVHFASLMDTCHLKNAELETKHQKYKGRVVLRGDIVKDDSGSYAVFTEQGSSASQMTAAKIIDIISRLPGCAGQAADAVSAYTQVKMGRCSQIIENSKIGMSRHLESSTTTQMAKIIVQYGRPSRSSWTKSVRSSFGRTIVGKAI